MAIMYENLDYQGRRHFLVHLEESWGLAMKVNDYTSLVFHSRRLD